MDNDEEKKFKEESNKPSQILENLRTEYSSLLQYHSTIIQFRFMTISFFLASVGLIVGADANNKGIILIILGVGVWLIELRNRCIFPNLLKRGRFIEKNLWSLKHDKEDELPLFCSMTIKKVGQKFSYDTKNLKIFGFYIGANNLINSKWVSRIISHSFAFDFIFLAVILYGVYLKYGFCGVVAVLGIILIILSVCFLFKVVCFLFKTSNKKINS